MFGHGPGPVGTTPFVTTSPPRGAIPVPRIGFPLADSPPTFKPDPRLCGRGRSPPPRGLPRLHGRPGPVHGEPRAGRVGVRRAARVVAGGGVPAVGPAEEQARGPPPEGVEDPPAREGLPG